MRAHAAAKWCADCDTAIVARFLFRSTNRYNGQRIPRMDDQKTNRDGWGGLGPVLAIGFLVVVILAATSVVATIVHTFFSHR